MLIFFSPAGIQSLMKNFPNFEQKDIAIGSFGPTTAKAVKDAGLRLDLEAPSSAAPSMPQRWICLSANTTNKKNNSDKQSEAIHFLITSLCFIIYPL